MVISSSSILDFFRAELAKVPGKKKLTKKYLNVLCPFHMDRNPSCGIRIHSDSGSKGLGSFKCLSCGEHGSWNKFAERAGLQSLGKNYFQDKVVYRPEKYKRLLTVTELKLGDLLKLSNVANVRPWPKNTSWRGFKGGFVNRLGGLYGDWRPNSKLSFPICFFPVEIDGTLFGGIRAHVNPPEDKKHPKYLNTAGEWSLDRGLWPYDYVQGMLENYNPKLNFVVLVEGPRDAMKLICRGIPAMCILGVGTFSSSKAKMIACLPIDTVWVIGDGDEAGRTMNKLIRTTLKDMIRTRIVKLPMSEDKNKKYDPGSLSPRMLDNLKKLLFQSNLG